MRLFDSGCFSGTAVQTGKFLIFQIKVAAKTSLLVPNKAISNLFEIIFFVISFEPSSRFQFRKSLLVKYVKIEETLERAAVRPI